MPIIKDEIIYSLEVMFGINPYLENNSSHVGFIESGFKLKRKEFVDYWRRAKNEGGYNAVRGLHTYAEPLDIHAKPGLEGTGTLDMKDYFSPFKYLGDGNWTLHKWEQTFWDVTREMFDIIVNGGSTIAMFSITDNCMNMEGFGPWMHNDILNADKGRGKIGIYDPKALPFIEKMVDKAISEFGHLGEALYWELGNEITDVDMAKAIFKMLMDRGVSPDRICLGINANIKVVAGQETEGNALKEFRNWIRSTYGFNTLTQTIWPVHSHLSNGGWIASPSGFGKLTDWVMRPENWMALKGAKAAVKRLFNTLGFGSDNRRRIMFSTDGSIGDNPCDAHPNPNAKYKRRPIKELFGKWLNVIFSRYLIKDTAGRCLIWLEQFIKKQDIECILQTAHVVRGTYNNHFGKELYNVGKFPPIIDKPECEEGYKEYKICPDGSKVVCSECIDGKIVNVETSCPDIIPVEPGPSHNNSWFKDNWHYVAIGVAVLVAALILWVF